MQLDKQNLLLKYLADCLERVGHNMRTVDQESSESHPYQFISYSLDT